MPASAHHERHFAERVGWLRAAVLGANDGIVSTASLVLGVAAAEASRASVLVAGVAGLVAGAMSMAAGEYVSVSSQADSEASDRERERKEIEANPLHEHKELVNIYVERGLTKDLAEQVATQFMARDPLRAHLRDELGLSSTMNARPLQAAWTSALSFAVGATVPLLLAVLSSAGQILLSVSVGSLLALTLLGVLGARAGGARTFKAAARVTFWGAAAMMATAGIGRLFGVAV